VGLEKNMGNGVQCCRGASLSLLLSLSPTLSPLFCLHDTDNAVFLYTSLCSILLQERERGRKELRMNGGGQMGKV